MSHRMNKELVLTALRRAIRKQPPVEGLIHHSDRGANMPRMTSEHYWRNTTSREV